MGKTKFFFVTDVHGSDICFRKFLNASKFYKANVLILGGDITGKSMVPIVDTSTGFFECTYAGENFVLKSREQAEVLIKEIRNGGAYTQIVNQKEYEELTSNPDKVQELFKRLMIEGVRKWIQLAEEKLKGTGTLCFISPGNDDIFEIDEVLNSSSFVVNPEEKVVDIGGGQEMITLGFANRTPWHSPREAGEEVLQSKIERMASELNHPETSIFNLHVPPIDTPIDQAPKVDSDLKPVVNAGHLVMTSAGSIATRNAILKYQPLAGLHGHIHEAKGVVRLGKTVCLNPGSEYGEGVLRGVLGQVEDGKLRSYLLTSG
ncbi:MAG: metallophosphoesterase [Thaumarchaeota archaeon]|nr:metallophosphoesterase [Nitrososphaerota archaeon]